MRLVFVASEASTVMPSLIRRASLRIPAPLVIRMRETESHRWTPRDYATHDALFGALEAYRPEAVIFINRLGCGAGFPLAAWCEISRVRCIPWYVDNPFFLSSDPHDRAFDSIIALVNNRHWLAPLKASGMSRVHFVPMATDPERFAPGPPAAERDVPIALIADLGLGRYDEILKDIIGQTGLDFHLRKSEILSRIAEAAIRLTHERDAFPLDLIEATPAIRRLIEHPVSRRSLACLIDLRASLIERLRYVKALWPLGIQVWGGPDWLKFIPPQHWHGTIHFTKVHAVYQRAKLVLNVSKLQSVQVADQRHYDSPAAGAALLTERHPGQLEFFDEDEMVYYSSPEEAVARARRLLENEDERLAIVERARAKIISTHTYDHRLDRIATIVRETSWPERVNHGPELLAELDSHIDAFLSGGQLAAAKAWIDAMERNDPTTAAFGNYVGAYALMSGRSAEIALARMNGDQTAFADRWRRLARIRLGDPAL